MAADLTREEIVEKSLVKLMTANPVPVVMGESVAVGGYNVLKESPYMDPVSGQYTIPVSGDYRCELGIGITKGRGSFKSFLCRSGNDGAKIEIDSTKGEDSHWESRDEVCKFEKDEKVWMEIVKESGEDVEVNAEFIVRLCQ